MGAMVLSCLVFALLFFLFSFLTDTHRYAIIALLFYFISVISYILSSLVDYLDRSEIKNTNCGYGIEDKGLFCKYSISPKNRYCPNCGKSLKHVYQHMVNYQVLLFLLVLMAFSLKYDLFDEVVIILTLSIIALIIFNTIFYSTDLKTWNSEEAQVYHNISTIDSNVAKYMNQYESLLKREEDIFEEGGTERLKETVNGINVATSVTEKNISFQHKKKRLQIMHVFVIRFERWVNLVNFFISTWPTFIRCKTENDVDKKLELLKSLYDDGKLFIHSNMVFNNPQLSKIKNKHKYVNYTNKTLALCQQMIDELIVKKVNINMKDVHYDKPDDSEDEIYEIRENQDSIVLDNIYNVIVFTELQKEELVRTEQDVQQEIDRLLIEQEL